MPVYKLNIKWQKERFSNVECNTDEGADKFKAVLFSLTGVPPERQKIMMPGKMLGEDFDGIRLKDGSTIMLLGTTEVLPTTKDVDTIPDVAVSKLTDDAIILPRGLQNLGNTCYANAAVQLLYSIPEVRHFVELSSLPPSPQTLTSPHSLVSSLKGLFRSLGSSTSEVIPFIFISCLRSLCPQFATTVDGETPKDANRESMLSMLSGKYAQQDANECWIALMGFLQNVTINPRIIQTMPAVFRLSSPSNDSVWNVVDRYFTGKMSTKLDCTESLTAQDQAAPLAEESTFSEQSFTQLSCYINQDVKFLFTGLKNNFEGSLTKHCPALGRDAVYKKVSAITRLPGYLFIHFVRFFYKEAKKLNAKVLKDVKFPLELDMFPFCSEELKQRLTPMREKIRVVEEEQSVRGSESAKQKAKVLDPEKQPELFEPYSLEDDPGSNNSGFYELQGVLSHQGRTSSAGHYVAWVKVSGTWMKFDDDVVTPVSVEEILRLSGGGEWHCAYLLLYGPKCLLRPVASVGEGSDAPGAVAPAAVKD